MYMEEQGFVCCICVEEKLGWVVMGQVGGAVSICDWKSRGTSCSEGMGGGFGSELVEVDVVRQW